MTWVCGLRSGILYTIESRPLDPRWSKEDQMVLLGWCANALHLGWKEGRAFQVAEAIVMQSKLKGLQWPSVSLNNDIKHLLETT